MKLPKPCGILGANDEFAIKAFHAAKSAGLSIPDEVAIVGIDNDEIYCESVFPGLTSVEPYFEGAGYKSDSFLIKMFLRRTNLTLRGYRQNTTF